MRLQIDEDYVITTDDRQFILCEMKVTSPDAKYPNKEYDYPISFWTTLENALEGYKRHRLLTSDAEGVAEIKELLEQIDKRIKKVKL